MTYQEAVRAGAGRLAGAGIENAGLESRLLFCELKNLSMSDFLLHGRDTVDDRDEKVFWEWIDRRCQRIPLQHITGRAYFYGLTFCVSADVLIPRPETEILVEEALGRLGPGDRILDLCTGSGCIAISLCHACPGLLADASDVSGPALALAEENAKYNGIPDENLRFYRGDLFRAVSGSRYDAILSNPPYIRREDIKGLMPEVKDHDPMLALDGGTDGLAFYRRIAAEAGSHLRPGGFLMTEIGADQGSDVAALFAEAGFEKVAVIKDYNGLDRIVTGEWN